MRLLGTGRLADSVAALVSTGGLVVVAGDVRLASALADRDLEVAVAGGDAQAAARRELRQVAIADLEAGSAAGAVLAGAAQLDDAVEQVRLLARVVAGGGVVVLLDKGARTRASRCALLGGLARLRQSVIARTVVTAGEV